MDGTNMPNDRAENMSYPVPARRGAAGAANVPRYLPDGSTPAGGALENWISPKFLLWVLGQWWMVVVPVGLVLAALAAGVVVYTYVPMYQATRMLTIEDTEPYVAFASRSHRGDRGYIQTQLQLLRSQIVLQPVLGAPGIASLPELVDAEDQLTHLQSNLSIKREGQSELYTFGYTSPSPQSAAKILDEIILKFMDTQKEEENFRSQRVIDILETKLAQQRVEVNRLRGHVVALAKEITGRDPFGVGEITDLNRALSPLGSLFQSVTNLSVEREIMEAELQSLKETPSSKDNSETNVLIDLQVNNHEEILKRQAVLDGLEAQMEQIKNDSLLLEKNPQWETKRDYVALKAEWTLGQENLKAEKLRVREEIITLASESKKAARELQIATLEHEHALLLAREKLLTKEFDDQIREQQSGGEKSMAMAFAQAELERENRVYELIAARQLALQTELQAPARIRLLQDKASIPTKPLAPIPYKQLLMACSAAFVAPFGLALLREITVKRISDIEQLAQNSGLRVLGEVVALPVRLVAVSPNQLSKRLRRDTHIYAESINSLRTNLALAEGLNRQVLVVTSASAGEGKTSVAVSLAMSIANATGKPTLIIDGDLRSPFVATMLRAKNQPGLFEVLSNTCKLDDAIQHLGDNGLCVIPGGHATRSTHRVLGIDELNRLLEQLRERFSTIVIDTPPILGASESLVLAKAADAVLFCALCGVSKAAQVRLAMDRLHHARVNVAGAVLSGTSAKRYQYVYGYYGSAVETAFSSSESPSVSVS
jgi:capsular exopolysaccharide synthesis family protein